MRKNEEKVNEEVKLFDGDKLDHVEEIKSSVPTEQDLLLGNEFNRFAVESYNNGKSYEQIGREQAAAMTALNKTGEFKL